MTGFVCLTFDDLFAGSWHAARPIFDEFGARATFCVCNLHNAKPRQVKKLRALQEDGHEIAFHSRTHPKLGPYLRQHGLAHWLEHEIDAGVAEHRALGFPAQSFASPFHAFTEETLAETAKRFRITRAAGPKNLSERDIPSRIYHHPGPHNAVDCLGFCDFQHRAFPGWEWQSRLLDQIASSGGTAVFAGHDIRAPGKGSQFFSTPEDLRRFLGAVVERGVGFRTLGEVGNLH